MKDNIKLFIRKKSYKELGDTGLYIHAAAMGALVATVFVVVSILCERV